MRRSALTLAMFAILLSPLSSQTWEGKIVKDGDVIVVQNPKTPLYPAGSLVLREELCIGGDNPVPKATLGLFAQVQIDSAGRIYVADMKDSLIKVYGADGSFLRAFGGKGQGPAEFRLVSELVLNPASGQVYAIDVLKTVIFSPTGEFERSVPVPERWTHTRRDSKGRFLAESSIRGPKTWVQFLKRYESLGEKGVVIKEWPGLNESKRTAFPARPAWDLDGNDRLYLAYGSDYRIEIMDAAGRVIQRIEKEDRQVPVSSEDKEVYRKSLPEALRSQPVEYENHFPYFRDFIVDEKGRVLVHTYKKSGDASRFDVFDEQGRFIAEIDLPFPVMAFRFDKIYTREYDAEGYLIVKRYALNWKK
jgi:hypothetical protein